MRMRGIVVVGVVVVVAVFTQFVSGVENAALQASADMKAQYAKLDAAIKRDDLQNVEKMLGDLQAGIKDAADQDECGALILHVCRRLSSTEMTGLRRHGAAHEALIQALSSGANMSLETRMELAALLLPTARNLAVAGGQPRSDDAVDRDVMLLLTTWARVRSTIDPKWQVDDRPHSHAPLPEGVWGEPGMPPDRIGDPALRAKYIAAVLANEDKIVSYNVQYNARRLLRKYENAFQAQVVPLYAQAARFPRFKQLLAESGMDEVMANSMLKTIEAKLRTASTAPKPRR